MMSQTVRDIGKSVRSMVRVNVMITLALHLVFTALGVVLFTPLIAGLGRLALYFSSYEVLADTDILFFFLSPYGGIILVLFAALLITIIIFEQAAIMTAYIAAAVNKRQELWQILSYTIGKSLVIFTFSVHLVIRLLAICIPFLALAGLVGLLTLTTYDINYYLANKPPVFWAAAAIIGVILLLMAWVVIRKLLSWSLALPLILFGTAAPKLSFGQSSELVKGNKKVVALLLIGWLVSVSLLSALLLGLVHQLASFIVPLFYDSMTMLLIVIGFILILWSLGNFLVTALAAGSFGSLLIEIARHFGQSVSLEGPLEANKHWQFRLSRSRLVVAGIAGVIISFLIGAWLVDSIKPFDDITIIAHRGAAGRAPENTMAAVKAAIEDKADWVEIDVQETVDGQVVVVHDSDFMKLAGVDLKVWDGTLEQIQQIDVGSWFNKDFSDERVPTLAQVLQESKGKAKVVIELKYYGHDEQLEQRVIDIVEQEEMVENTAIMSLKFDGVQKVRKIRPDWPVGLLSAQVLGNMSNLDVDFLAVNMAMAGPAFITTNQEAGKRVFVWTVNDAISMFQVMSRGVDGIITDEPALARQVIAERSELNAMERLLIHAAMLLGKPLPQKEYRDQSP